MKWSYVKINQIESPISVDTLSPSRRSRIDRLKNENAKNASLAGEWLVRSMLAGAVVCSKENGQPYIQNSDSHVSISHSGEYAVAVISESPVGIDIEKIRDIKDSLVDRVCTDREKQYVGRNRRRFFKIWTAKEAYFKKIGTGITDFKAVETLDIKKEYHTLGDYIICII